MSAVVGKKRSVLRSPAPYFLLTIASLQSNQSFECGATLGTGTFGRVFVAKHKASVSVNFFPLLFFSFFFSSFFFLRLLHRESL